MPALQPEVRDRALGRVRWVTWATCASSVALTAALSVASAHAFKGHQRTPATTLAIARRHPATGHVPVRARVHVAPPQAIPSIARAQTPLQAPSRAPSPAPAPSQTPAPAPTPAPPPQQQQPQPQPAPAPPPPPAVSGGS